MKWLMQFGQLGSRAVPWLGTTRQMNPQHSHSAGGWFAWWILFQEIPACTDSQGNMAELCKCMWYHPQSLIFQWISVLDHVWLEVRQCLWFTYFFQKPRWYMHFYHRKIFLYVYRFCMKYFLWVFYLILKILLLQKCFKNLILSSNYCTVRAHYNLHFTDEEDQSGKDLSSNSRRGRSLSTSFNVPGILA